MTSSRPDRQKNEMEIFVQGSPPVFKAVTRREEPAKMAVGAPAPVPVMRLNTDSVRKQSRAHPATSMATGA